MDSIRTRTVPRCRLDFRFSRHHHPSRRNRSHSGISRDSVRTRITISFSGNPQWSSGMLRPVATPKPMRSTFVFEPDECQRQAIEHVHGPMLVIAGAGTGKTTVLTKRIARLVREGHARPDEVLAVTYTKNAAQEMRQRVREELRGTDLSALRIATFHEYCNDLLRENDRPFDVVDDQDLWIYLRRRLRELNLK